MMNIRYIVKNKHTGSIYKKFYHIEEVERKGLCALFDIDNYEIINRDRYTGLKDKNGKMIFEGDTVSIGHRGAWSKDSAEIKFSYAYAGGWVASSEGEECNIGTRTDCIKVTGTIYDKQGE